MGWFGMRSLLESIELAKSTEPAAIVKALETWRVKEGDLEVGYRDFDHQMKRRTVICKVKDKIPDKWDYVDVLENAPKTAAEIDEAFGSAANSACKMDSI
jgi:branched-chain amino acid transport system substrate-binding protein